VLVDRGELDVYAPVARYWPQFAANGKADIEVRHLLSHTSGVSGWEPPFNHDEVYDWDRSTSLLAAQAPWWEPGSASGYHDTSFGHLVGEVVRRISGTSIGRFFADEIAGPLGADFHIGLPEKDLARVSNVVFPGYPFPEDPLAEPLDPDSVPAKTFGPPFDLAAVATDAWRRAEIPAANGHGNARSVARIQSIVSTAGEVDGVRLLSPRTIELIFDQQSDGGRPRRWATGPVRDRLRPATPRPRPIHPRRSLLFLVRVGRCHHRQRPRPADDLRLCDEQDGLELARRLRYRAHQGLHQSRILVCRRLAPVFYGILTTVGCR
jgi:CubicO group peptidase (beta-lactamase class C family)